MNRNIKKLLLATVDVWDPLWIGWYRLRTGETGPIPPFKNRDRIGARDISWFLRSGEADAQTFRQAIQKWSDKKIDELALLDLGAGCGRILRHFVDDAGSLAAADVDPTAIRYVAAAYPQTHSVTNHSTPPLPFADESFDVIYAFSVWTHLPIKLQEEWLEEAGRVLRLGGLLLISTMGYRALKLLREGEKPLEREWHTVGDEDLKREGAIYHEYPIYSQGEELFSGISESYGVAAHDPDYIRRVWAGKFEVLEIVEGAFREHQDLVVLRKT